MAEALYEVQARYNVRIPARGGIELSANLWLPVPCEPGEKFPAVLEMIPYRKDDYRYIADHQRMTYLSQRGFAGCRLDIRGTGSSQGFARDEYTSEETQDGYDAVEWLAVQPWCNGNVGMWGKSYGGFTAIQVAILQPPHLKAIVPVYATDDRYTDDVHYIGGCMVASEFGQYAVSQIGMNAMPPKIEYAGSQWAEQWKQRLENTSPWLIEWIKQQTDSPYWRSGSLASDYDRIQCAMFLIGGWHDGYTDPVLRMMEKCTAPRKALIGNWTHTLPHNGYPGPNVDWMHEMVRFFEYWLKGADNGMAVRVPADESAFTYFRREYTDPEPFPIELNGQWAVEVEYPPSRSTPLELFLGDSTLLRTQYLLPHTQDQYPHRPIHGTHDALCWGGGSAPNGLARDLRPDEALALNYTSEPLEDPLDILGFPEAILYLSSTAPIAHVVVRLNDVAPDGTVQPVTRGVLNLTHRNGHEKPEPLASGQVYEIRVKMKAAGYRFLPGHRIRLSVASAYWPVIWPSPYPAENTLHRGPETPSRLILPTLPGDSSLQPLALKTTPPDLISLGEESYSLPIWRVTDDVINQSVTVKVYSGDTSILPDRTRIFTSEMLEMTAFERDPARAWLFNEVEYELEESGYQTQIHASGSIRSTQTDFHVDVQLRVELNGAPFFQKSWLESIPRNLL